MSGNGYPGRYEEPRRRSSGRYEPDQEFRRPRHGRQASQEPQDYDYGAEPDRYGAEPDRYAEAGPDRYGAEPDRYAEAGPDRYGAEPDRYAEAGRYDDAGYAQGYGDWEGYGQAEPTESYSRADPGSGPAEYYDPYGGNGGAGYDDHAGGSYAGQDWDAGDGQEAYRDSYEQYADYDQYGRDERYAADAGAAGWQQEDDARAPDYEEVPRRYRRGAGEDSPALGHRAARRPGAADGGRDAGAGRRGFFGGYADDEDDHGPRRRRRIPAGAIALIVIGAVIGGIGYTGYHFWHEYQVRHMSYTGSGYGHVNVIVKPGDTGDTIAAQLVDKGVVGSIDSWASYVATQPNKLQPGEYRLHEHMGNAQAWAMLLNPKDRVNSTVTIPDGLRESKILPLLAKSSNIPLSQFQAAIKETSKLGLPSYANGNPEGYLYPDTYDIVPGSTTALQVLQMAVHQFNVEAAKLHLVSVATKDDFTPAQVIAGASLLEAEVGPKYYADVARVIDNRLNGGMDLDLDSTVSYVTGNYSYNLSASQLQVNSPYNTFIHPGLPPGPIDSPGAAAIQAFLHPASSSNNWLYFVTVNKKGLTEFTNSPTQFNIWSQQAKQNGV